MLEPSRVMNVSTVCCVKSDPAQEAYNDAIKFFRDHLTVDEQKHLWAGRHATIKDAEDAVISARTKYESTRSDSKVKRWLSKLSSRIMFYGSILDVLAQYYPEYVSLAWGSIKFLLQGVLNNEELLARIGKALTEIGDALPRIKIQAALYTDDSIKQAVSLVYANIMKFFHRAITWYSASRMKRALAAIWQPYELRFKDLVDEIARCSRNVDQLAFTASQMELRQIRLEQQDLLQVVQDTRRIMIEHQAINFRGFLDSSRRICEIQFSQILTATALTSLPPPDRVFRQTKFLSARRRLTRLSNDDRLWWQSRKLREWASSTSSSLLLVQASFLSRIELKDFTVDLVDLLLGLQVPVVWALSPSSKVDDTSTSTSIDILKQLVYQILQINHSLLAKQSSLLNAARFQSAATEDEWFDLLAGVLDGMPQIYIVLDGNLLTSQLENEVAWPSAMKNMIEALRVKCPDTVVKVFLTIHNMPNQTNISAPESMLDETLRLQSLRRSGIQRGKQLAGRPNSRLLRPFIAPSSGKPTSEGHKDAVES